LRLEIDLDELAAEVATRVAVQLAEQFASQAPTPWMAMDEAIAYTRIPAGTFRKWVAAGRIPAHGGRRRLFHRAELDASLGYPGGVGTSSLDGRGRAA
jgi:excisionase family DNA binding protein